MVPMEVASGEDDAEDFGDDAEEGQESRFYSCHVCGDNWLSVKEPSDLGDCRVTFVHQMGMHPTLRRVAHLPTAEPVNEPAVDKWSYFLGDDEVDQSRWHKKLNNRRRILKSICSN
jgi:hypothetical protein